MNCLRKALYRDFFVDSRTDENKKGAIKNDILGGIFIFLLTFTMQLDKRKWYSIVADYLKRLLHADLFGNQNRTVWLTWPKPKTT